MITELEQEFYDTFGIEPEINYVCDKEPCEKELLEDKQCKGCSHLYDTREDYPEITAEKLLEMICILNNYGKYDCWGVTIARLKKAILENCIVVVVSKLLNDAILEQFKQQIQQLFREKGIVDNNV